MCQNSGSGIYAFVLPIYFLMHLLNFMGVKKMANDVKNDPKAVKTTVGVVTNAKIQDSQ